MSTELTITANQIPAELKAMCEKSLAADMAAAGSKYLRYPKVKIGHSNQTFSLPNNQVTKELYGWAVTHASFMEYYEKKESGEEDENKAPICAAINTKVGSKFGDCTTCSHYEWKASERNPDKKYRECSSSYRVLIAVKGLSQPLELKIPQTSYGKYEKAFKEALSTTGLTLAVLNMKVTLSSKKEGSQEWSLFEFAFEPMSATSQEELNKKAFERLKFRMDRIDYFQDVYGAMNANASHTDAKPAAPASDNAPVNEDSGKPETMYDKVKKGATKKAKKDESDAEIIIDTGDVQSENAELSSLQF